MFFNGCTDSKKNQIQLEGKTMGTRYHITVIAPSSNKKFTPSILQKEIDELLIEINRQISTYIPNSEISQFNQHNSSEWFAVSSDFAFIASAAQNVSKLTDGAFDITIAPLIDLWGFGAKTQLIPPSDAEVMLGLESTGYQLLEVRQSPPALRKHNTNLRIDLSAIAKGFAVDKISTLLKQKNYSNYLVEIGGEIHLQGKNQLGKPWRIGIEWPDLKKTNANTSLLLSNLSLATSGDYRNYFVKGNVRYSHTINPKTGKPVIHKLASVTVLHQSTMMADAYATALMVMGDEAGKVFATTNQLSINMIIRKTLNYETWRNINDGLISIN